MATSPLRSSVRKAVRRLHLTTLLFHILVQMMVHLIFFS